jgi:hypothetical protein
MVIAPIDKWEYGFYRGEYRMRLAPARLSSNTSAAPQRQSVRANTATAMAKASGDVSERQLLDGKHFFTATDADA